MTFSILLFSTRIVSYLIVSSEALWLARTPARFVRFCDSMPVYCTVPLLINHRSPQLSVNALCAIIT